MSDHEIILIIGIIVIIAIIAYGIYLYYSYTRKSGFFNYTKPPLPNSFQPTGKVTTLTPEELQARRNALTNGSTKTQACFGPPCSTSS